jgi:spoIIIJ-associated protein
MPLLEYEKARSQVDDFLKGLLLAGRFRLKYRIEKGLDSGPDILVNFDGEDTDLLLAHNGELLAAMEHLAAKALRLSIEEQSRLSFDCHEYKSLHEAELRLMAEAAAERVARSRVRFEMSPMNSRDRRIIHLALKDHSTVRTESEGGGPNRKVVLYPKERPR